MKKQIEKMTPPQKKRPFFLGGGGQESISDKKRFVLRWVCILFVSDTFLSPTICFKKKLQKKNTPKLKNREFFSKNFCWQWMRIMKTFFFRTKKLKTIYFLGGKVYFFWHSETMENYIQNFRLFSLPKICF